MGSSGTGNFSDYSGTPKKEEKGGGSSGGSSGTDKCGQAFSTGLEDVQLHGYYKKNGTVPALGAKLAIELKSRVVAVDDTGLAVGSLPTQFNYLVACMEAGFKYVGVVTVATNSPVPKVTADFVAT